MKIVSPCVLLMLIPTMTAFGGPQSCPATPPDPPAAIPLKPVSQGGARHGPAPATPAASTSGQPAGPAAPPVTIDGQGAFNATSTFSGKATTDSGANAKSAPVTGTMTVEGTVTIKPLTLTPPPPQFGVYSCLHACLYGPKPCKAELMASGAFSATLKGGVWQIHLSIATQNTPSPCLQGEWSLLSQAEYKLTYYYRDATGHFQSRVLDPKKVSAYSIPTPNKNGGCTEGSLTVDFDPLQPNDLSNGNPVFFDAWAKCHGINPDFCKCQGPANAPFLALSGTLRIQADKPEWSVGGNPDVYFPTWNGLSAANGPPFDCPRALCGCQL